MTLALTPPLGAWTSPLKPVLSAGELVVSRAQASAVHGLDMLVPHLKAPDWGLDHGAPHGFWASVPLSYKNAAPKAVAPVASPAAETHTEIGVDAATDAQNTALELSISTAGLVLASTALYAAWRSLDLSKNFSGQLQIEELFTIHPSLLFRDVVMKLGMVGGASLVFPDLLMRYFALMDFDPAVVTAFHAILVGTFPVMFVDSFVTKINRLTLTAKHRDKLPYFYAREAARYVNAAVSQTSWRGGPQGLSFAAKLLRTPVPEDTAKSDEITSLLDTLFLEHAANGDPYNHRNLVSVMVLADLMEVLNREDRQCLITFILIRAREVFAPQIQDAASFLEFVRVVTSWLETLAEPKASVTNIPPQFAGLEFQRALFHEVLSLRKPKPVRFTPRTTLARFFERYKGAALPDNVRKAMMKCVGEMSISPVWNQRGCLDELLKNALKSLVEMKQQAAAAK